jgi:hypothetical protein
MARAPYFRFSNSQRPPDAPVPPRINVLGSREGRCYELAGRGVVEYRDWLLVHGTAYGTGHAWLERESWIYDAVIDQLMTSAQYKSFARAAGARTYTAKETAELAASSRHWGPWY